MAHPTSFKFQNVIFEFKKISTAKITYMDLALKGFWWNDNLTSQFPHIPPLSTIMMLNDSVYKAAEDAWEEKMCKKIEDVAARLTT